MKSWMLIIPEESSSCVSCGRIIDFGKPAFILVDTDQIPWRVEWVNCLECMKVKFPEAVEGL